jgi:hypothetical protein
MRKKRRNAWIEERSKNGRKRERKAGIRRKKKEREQE